MDKFPFYIAEDITVWGDSEKEVRQALEKQGACKHLSMYGCVCARHGEKEPQKASSVIACSRIEAAYAAVDVIPNQEAWEDRLEADKNAAEYNRLVAERNDA